MRLKLRNPTREIERSAPSDVGRLLEELGVVRESVLVIRNGTLVTPDERLEETDEVEIRPVMSGGAF
ncbi:MAG: MoaD/ThiS family protein [Actinomycetota bacterium]